MPQSTSVASPPAVEPSSPNGVVSGLTEWTVTYTITRQEVVTVQAKTFNDAAIAAAATEAFPIDVVAIAKVRN